jgi:hypothetical protein
MTENPDRPDSAPEPAKPASPADPPRAPMAGPEPIRLGAEPAKADAPKPVPPDSGKPEAIKPEVINPAPAKPAAGAAEAPKPAKSLPPKPASGAQMATPARQPAQSSRSALAVFSAIGFLLLAAAVFFLWQELQIFGRQVDPARVATMQAEMSNLQQRVAELEARPVPVPPAPVDLGPLEGRVAALEQRPATPADPTAALSADVTALQGRVAQAEAHATQVSDTAARSARLESAGVALAFGQPLGAIPGAPAALTRFATANPPTEASLRLEFSGAARQAETASRPDTAGQSFGQRVWQRIASLVTVREGSKVLVGAPAAVVLGTAQDKLEAGDLAGAVAALDGLDGPAAQAMAPWRAHAQALLDARAALAAMARG